MSGFDAQMEQIVAELERAGVVRPNETPLETIRRLLAYYRLWEWAEGR